MQYQIEKYECNECPFKSKCIKSYPKKVIRRHMYTDCLEQCRNYRLSEEGKLIYKLCKTTIERVFAEAKENHGLRFTRFRGLKKIEIYKVSSLCMSEHQKISSIIK